MSALTLNTIFTSKIENKTNSYGISEDHNIFEVSLTKGFKYTFELKTDSQYRDIQGIDRFNNININIKEPGDYFPLGEHDGLVVDKTISGSTLISFVAKETGTYSLDIFGKAGYSNTTEYGESDRIDTPFTLVSTQSDTIVDAHSDTSANAVVSTLDQTNTTTGFEYTEISSNLYHSVNDKDYFSFTADVAKDYIISVITSDGIYKNISVHNVGYNEIVLGKNGSNLEQQYITPNAKVTQDTNGNDIVETERSITFKVDGGKGDYTVKIEEASIDPEQSVKVEDANLTVGTAYTSTLYSKYDIDFFKVDNLIEGDIYRIKLVSSELREQDPNYNFDFRGYTEGIIDYAHSENFSGSYRKIEDGEEYYFIADSTQAYDMRLHNVWQTETGSYTIIVDHMEEETLASIVDINNDTTNRVFLTEGQTITAALSNGGAGDDLDIHNDFFAVDMSVAGTYTFNLKTGNQYLLMDLFNEDGSLTTTNSWGNWGQTNDNLAKGNLAIDYTKSKIGNWFTGQENLLTVTIDENQTGTYYIGTSWTDYVSGKEVIGYELGYDYELLTDTDSEDTFSLAKVSTKAEVEVGNKIESSLSDHKDTDWFKIELKAGEIYKIDYNSDSMYNLDVSIKYETGEWIHNRDVLGDALSEVISSVYTASNNNMQKTLDFIEGANLDRFEKLTNIFKENAFEATGLEREEFSMYTQLIDKIDILSIENVGYGLGYYEDGVRTRYDENGDFISHSSINLNEYYGDKLNMQYKSGDGSSRYDTISIDPSTMGESVNIAIKELNSFAKDLKVKAILENNITNSDISTNIVSADVFNTTGVLDKYKTYTANTESFTKSLFGEQKDYSSIVWDTQSYDRALIELTKYEVQDSDNLFSLMSKMKSLDTYISSDHNFVENNQIKITVYSHSLNQAVPTGYTKSLDKIIVTDGMRTVTVDGDFGYNYIDVSTLDGKLTYSLVQKNTNDNNATDFATYILDSKTVSDGLIPSTAISQARENVDVSDRIASQFDAIVDIDKIGSTATTLENLSAMNNLSLFKVLMQDADVVLTDTQNSSFSTLLNTLTYNLLVEQIDILNGNSYDSSTSSDVIFDNLEVIAQILNIVEISGFSTTEKDAIKSSLETTKNTLVNLVDIDMLSSKIKEYETMISDPSVTDEQLNSIHSSYSSLNGLDEYTILKSKTTSLVDSLKNTLGGEVTTYTSNSWSHKEYDTFVTEIEAYDDNISGLTFEQLLVKAESLNNLLNSEGYYAKNNILDKTDSDGTVKLRPTPEDGKTLESFQSLYATDGTNTIDIDISNATDIYTKAANNFNMIKFDDIDITGLDGQIGFYAKGTYTDGVTDDYMPIGLSDAIYSPQIAVNTVISNLGIEGLVDDKFTSILSSIDNNSTNKENITAFIDLNNIKDQVTTSGLSLSTSQLSSYTIQQAKLTQELLLAEINGIDMSSYMTSTTLDALFSAIELSTNLRKSIEISTYTQVEENNLLYELQNKESALINLVTSDMLSTKLAEITTVVNDTNSTTDELLAINEDMKLLSSIVAKLDVYYSEFLIYKDSYQTDLLSMVTQQNFNDYIDSIYGSSVTNWWSVFSENAGESFKIEQDGTYYLQFGLQTTGSPRLESGDYEFTVLSMDTSDVGATFNDAGDFKQIDLDDHTSTKEKEALAIITAASNPTEVAKVEHENDGVVNSIFNSDDDKDMYKVKLDANKLYEFKVDHGGAELKLYAEDGTRIVDKYGSNLTKVYGSNELTYKFMAPTTQNYYLEVSKDSYSWTSSKEDYKLTVNDLTAGDIAGNNIESAAVYTDTVADATTKTNTFKLDYVGDSDWYKIDTVSGNYYNIDLTSDTKYFKMNIYDSLGNHVSSESNITMMHGTNMDEMDIDIGYTYEDWDEMNDTTSDVQVAWNLYASPNFHKTATGGTYYVEVINYSGTGSYNLSVTDDNISDDYGSTADTAGDFHAIDAADTNPNDGVITANFGRRNDKDWFSYNWDKAIYTIKLTSSTVDKYELNFFNEYSDHTKDVTWAFGIKEDFVLNRLDTTGETKNYIVTSQFSSFGDAKVEIKNIFGAGDYSLEINKIADLDTGYNIISLDTDGSYTNTSDAIAYQTDSTEYWIKAIANKTYQIELSADEIEAAALGQLIVTVINGKGNVEDIIKEWNPSDVMTRLTFTSETDAYHKIVIKTANSAKTNTQDGYFAFNIKELDLSNDIGSSIETASEFNTLAVNGIVVSNIDTTIDKDWLKYTFEEGKQYLISVDMTNSENGLVYIYDSEGKLYKSNQMWDTTDALTTSDKTILFNPSESGEFYIEVANAVTGEYSLNVEEYTDTTDILNTSATSATIDVDANPIEVLTSLIDNKDDKDWIKVELTAGQIYKIEAIPSGDKMPIPLDLVINGIYNSSSELITGTTSKNGIQYIKPSQDGIYYIEIAGKNDTLGFYDIQVSTDSSSDSISADANTTANVVVGTKYDGKIDYFFDKDWIKVTLEAGKTYDINMIGDSLSDTHLTGLFLSSDLNINLASNNDANRYTLNSKVQVTVSGNAGDASVSYYIEASGYNDLKGTYSIDVNESTTLEVLANETEGADANNTIDSSIDGLLGRYQYGEINYSTDSDLYKYEFEAGVTYEINMYGSDSKLGSLSNSFIKSIKDGSGVEIAGTSNAHGGKGNDSLLTFTAESSGTYYVEVASQYHAQGSFRLKVKEQSDGLGGVAPTALGDGSHTVMVYMAADNNLEGYLLHDLIELQLANIPANWNVTFLIDRAEGFDTTHGDWTDTRQGMIKFADASVDDFTAHTEILSGMESLGELDTGDGATLTNFINWSTQVAEADSYSLIMSNHGGGIVGSMTDDSSGGIIAISEMSNAIEATTVHQNALASGDKAFEVISFFTCLQGVIDQQYALKDYTDYVVASEELGWTNFFDFEGIFNKIGEFDKLDQGTGDTPIDGTVGNVTGEQMATLIVEFMKELDESGRAGQDMTYSAVDTELLDEVVTATADLNASLATISATDKQRIKAESESSVIFSHESQMDLGTFAQIVDNLDIGGAGSQIDQNAQAVKTAIANAVISNYTNMSGNGGDATGIAINYNGGVESSNYMNNFELASLMNMHEFFEVV